MRKSSCEVSSTNARVTAAGSPGRERRDRDWLDVRRFLGDAVGMGKSRTSRKVDREKTGERVRDLRELVGLTQAALAEQVGVTTETISRMERGLYDPAIGTLLAVVDCFDVELDYLVGRTDRKGKKPQSAMVTKLIARMGKLSPKSQRLLAQLAESLS